MLLEFIRTDVSCLKIFDSTPWLVYWYTDETGSKPYSSKRHWTSEKIDHSFSVEEFKNQIVTAAKDVVGFKTCRLNKDTKGIRIRFENGLGTYQKEVLVNRFIDNLRKVKYKDCCDAELPGAMVPVLRNLWDKPCSNMALAAKPSTENAVEVKCGENRYVYKKKEKEVNDFSFSNLKDALVRKITTLDKKTITILSIIALLLLIATRYQDIKDILIGIKNKVVKSKNYKAMIEDGTNALNNLKKIVGVKAEAKDE